MSNPYNQPNTLHTADGVEQVPNTTATLWYINSISGEAQSITGKVSAVGRLVNPTNGDADFVDNLFSTAVAALTHQLKEAQQDLSRAQIRIDRIRERLGEHDPVAQRKKVIRFIYAEVNTWSEDELNAMSPDELRTAADLVRALVNLKK